MRLSSLPAPVLDTVWSFLGDCGRRALRLTSHELLQRINGELTVALTALLSATQAHSTLSSHSAQDLQHARAPAGPTDEGTFANHDAATPQQHNTKQGSPQLLCDDWHLLCRLVRSLRCLGYLSITLLPSWSGCQDLLQCLKALGEAVPPCLQHLHLDIRCAELSPGLLAAVAACFPNSILCLELYGLGAGTTTSAGNSPASNNPPVSSEMSHSSAPFTTGPRTNASDTSSSSRDKPEELSDWQQALALLPIQLTQLYLAAIDQDGWFRRSFIRDQDLQGLTHLVSLRELKITGLTNSQVGNPVNISALQPLVTSGSLTHITIGAVPLCVVDLDGLSSWQVNPKPRYINNVINSALSTFSGCHVAARTNKGRGCITLDTHTGGGGSKCAYLGIAAGAHQLRVAWSLEWPGFWTSIKTLWLRGMSTGFTLEDIAMIGTLPNLKELFMSSCLQKGRLSQLPPGCLTCLSTLKLWWVSSSDLLPGELAGLLQGGALAPSCRLLLTSGPCIDRARQCPLLTADCKALAAHPGGWSTQLTSRKVLCELKGLILFYERSLGAAMAEALAPLLPTMDGLVVSSPSPEVAMNLLAAEWLAGGAAPYLNLLGAQCNDWAMLHALLKAAHTQVLRPGCRITQVIARIWGTTTINNLSSPAALAAFKKLLTAAPPDFSIKVCVEEGGLMPAITARATIQQYLAESGCDPDALQVLVW